MSQTQTCARCSTSTFLNPSLQLLRSVLRVGGTAAAQQADTNRRALTAAALPDGVTRCDHLLCQSCLTRQLDTRFEAGGARCPVDGCSGFWKKALTESAAASTSASSRGPNMAALAVSIDAEFPTEMKIRKEILEKYYRRPENFARDADPEQGYNDYLEDVEDMVYSMMQGLDEAAIRQKIDEYGQTPEASANQYARDAEIQGRKARVDAELEDRRHKRVTYATQDAHEVDDIRLENAQADHLFGVGTATLARLALRRIAHGRGQDQQMPTGPPSMVAYAAPPLGLQQLGPLPSPLALDAPSVQPASNEGLDLHITQKRARAGAWDDGLMRRRAIQEATCLFVSPAAAHLG